MDCKTFYARSNYIHDKRHFRVGRVESQTTKILVLSYSNDIKQDILEKVSSTYQLVFIETMEEAIIKLSEFHSAVPCTVVGNTDFLDLAFREVLVNACKYSPENSTINIYSYVRESYISILFMNSILQYTRGVSGVPMEMEHEVFEPFFRINNVYDERFLSEEFGLGLGLTIVRDGIHKLGGRIYLYEVNDNVTNDISVQRKVITELILARPEVLS
ncbi:MAG: ATP-binding protein [Spirochaetota bacterium]